MCTSSIESQVRATHWSCRGFARERNSYVRSPGAAQEMRRECQRWMPKLSLKRCHSSKACRCVYVAPGFKVLWCRLVLLLVTRLGDCGQISMGGAPGEFLTSCLMQGTWNAATNSSQSPWLLFTHCSLLTHHSPGKAKGKGEVPQGKHLQCRLQGPAPLLLVQQVASGTWEVSFLTCSPTDSGPAPSICPVASVLPPPARRKLTHVIMITALPSFPLLLYPVSVYPHIYPVRCSEQFSALLILWLRELRMAEGHQAPPGPHRQQMEDPDFSVLASAFSWGAQCLEGALAWCPGCHLVICSAISLRNAPLLGDCLCTPEYSGLHRNTSTDTTTM